MYKYKWFNYHKGRYVDVIRIEKSLKQKHRFAMRTVIGTM